MEAIRTNTAECVATPRGLVSCQLPPKRLDLLVPPPFNHEGLIELQQAVASHFGFCRKDLLGRFRTKNLALARQLAMAIARQRYRLSYIELGAAFGGRDHTTAMHAVKVVRQRMAHDPWLRAWFERLMPPGPRLGEAE